MIIKKRRGNGNNKKPPDNPKVVDLKVFQGKKNVLSLEQLNELRQELDDYKVHIPDDVKKNKQFIKIAEALVANNGYISKTATSLGMGYVKFKKLLDENEKLNEIVQNTTEAMLDLAENKLRDQILTGNLTAIIFYLANKGAARGWRNEYRKANEVLEETAKVPVFNYDIQLPKNFKLVPVEEEKIESK